MDYRIERTPEPQAPQAPSMTIGNYIDRRYPVRARRRFSGIHGAENSLILAPRAEGIASEGRARDALEKEKRRIAALRSTLLGSSGYDTLGDPSGLLTPEGGY
jgi:hypothetical protein